MPKEGKTMLKTLTIAAAAACFVVPAQAASIADPYTSFIVLGDSLSDPGNIADSIESSITLHSVKDFLVMNLPGFDLIPLFSGADAPTRAFVRSVSDNFNAI